MRSLFLSRLLASLTRKPTRPIRRATLKVEPLEDRVVPSSNYDNLVLSYGPTALYKLNESSGPTMTNSAYATNSGVYSTKGLTYDTPGPIASSPADSAITLDGASGYGTIYSPTAGTFDPFEYASAPGTNYQASFGVWFKTSPLGTIMTAAATNETWSYQTLTTAANWNSEIVGSAGGVTFSIPSPATSANPNNNVLEALGQTITLPAGKYTNAYLLAASTNGDVTSGNHTFSFNYSTGTGPSSYTQNLSAWGGASLGYANESPAVIAGYRDRNGGTMASLGNVFAYTYSLTSTKTLASLTLPNNGNINIIGIDLRSTTGKIYQVNLTSNFNRIGIVNDGQTIVGGVILGQTNTYDTNGVATTPSESGAAPKGDIPAVMVGTNGDLYVSMFDFNGTANNNVISSAPVDTGTWQFLEVVYNNSMESVYLDGQLIGTQNRSEASYGSGTYDYFLGTGYAATYASDPSFSSTKSGSFATGWSYFLGSLSEASVNFGVALTQQQVVAQYQAATADPYLNVNVTNSKTIGSVLPSTSGSNSTSVLQDPDAILPGGPTTYTITVTNPEGLNGIKEASETGNTITIATFANTTIAAGDTVDVTGVPVGGYNGVWTVLSTGTFTTGGTKYASFTYTDPTSGLDPDYYGGGAIDLGQKTAGGAYVGTDAAATVAGTITDDLPANITGWTWTASYTSPANAPFPQSSGPTSGNGNISAAITLAPGGTATFTITAELSVTAIGSLSDTATATVSGGGTTTATVYSPLADITTNVAYVNNTSNTSGFNAGVEGMAFNVNGSIPVEIDQLGVFDNGGFKSAATTIVAVLYNRVTGQPMTYPQNGQPVELTFTQASPGTQNGLSTFKPLLYPLILQPGSQLMIVTSGYNATDEDDSNTGNPNAWTTNGNGNLLTFLGTGFASATGTAGNTYPTTKIDVGPQNAYEAGTFTFEPYVASGLTVNNTANPTTSQPGSTVTYTVTVTNNGSYLENGVAVTDPFSTGLSATSGNNQVSLSWTAIAGAAGYDIYRGTTSGGETLLTSDVTTNFYTDTTAVNGTKYYYKVVVTGQPLGTATNEASATPEAYTAPSTSLVTAVTSTGSVRTDTSYWIGGQLETGNTPITVTALGRIMVSGDTLTHTIDIFDPTTNTVVATATVNMLGGTVNQFVYANLASPVTLLANHLYYLIDNENAGDPWYNNGTNETTTSVATFVGAAYQTYKASGPSGAFTLPAGGQYVGLNILYSAVPPVGAPLPTTVAGFAGDNWTALYSAGSSGPANGSGTIDTYVNLAAGGTVTFTITGTLLSANEVNPINNTATATAPDMVPTNLTSASTLNGTGTKGAVYLSWAPVNASLSSSPVTYDVYRGTASGAESLLVSGLTTPSYLDTSGAPGTTYYYYVTAVYANLSNPPSTVANFASPPSNEITGTPSATPGSLSNGLFTQYYNDISSFVSAGGNYLAQTSKMFNPTNIVQSGIQPDVNDSNFTATTYWQSQGGVFANPNYMPTAIIQSSNPAGANYFSIAWTGYLKVPTTGDYNFRTGSDDGSVIFLNGTEIVNNWKQQGVTYVSSGNIFLTAGTLIPIQVYYEQGNGGSTCYLQWSPPGETGTWLTLTTANLYTTGSALPLPTQSLPWQGPTPPQTNPAPTGWEPQAVTAVAPVTIAYQPTTLTVTMNGNPTVDAGNTLTYHLTVTNTGAYTAYDVHLQDILPQYETFVSDTLSSGSLYTDYTQSDPAAGSSGTINDSFFTLGAGGSATFIWTVKLLTDTPSGNLSNTVIASADNAGTDIDSGSTTAFGNFAADTDSTGGSTYTAQQTISDASEAGTTVTITDVSNTFQTGQTVTIGGVPIAGYNGTFTVTGSTGTSFTYTDVNTGLAATSGNVNSIAAHAVNTSGNLVSYLNTTGKLYTSSSPISSNPSPAPMAIYQTDRYGASFTYTIPDLTANAGYNVRLDFAELQPSGGVDGNFTVTINGAPVLNPATGMAKVFNIGTSAGALYKAIDDSFQTKANSKGQIVIAFAGTGSGASDYAEVNGIQISPSSTYTTNVISQTTLTVTKTALAYIYLNTQLGYSATESGNTVTIYTMGADPLVVGSTVIVNGVSVAGYNGTFTVTNVTATTFTYTDSTGGMAEGNGGAAYTPTTTVNPGDYLGYLVTIADSGPSDAHNVVLSDVLPNVPTNEETFISDTQIQGVAGWTANDPAPGANGAITEKINDLAIGQSADFLWTVAVGNTQTSGTLANTAGATTTSTTNASSVLNATANVTINNPPANLAVTMTASGSGSATPGSDITYTITITNSGNDKATNVVLTDPLPAGLTIVSSNQTSGPAFSQGTLYSATEFQEILTTPTGLLPGKSATFTLEVQVPVAATPGTPVNNIVTGSASNRLVTSNYTLNLDSGLTSPPAPYGFVPDADFTGGSTYAAGDAITNASETGTTVTLQTTGTFTFAAGQQVIISGVPVAGYNGTFTLLSATGGNITYTDAAGLATTSGGIAAHAINTIALTDPDPAPAGVFTTDRYGSSFTYTIPNLVASNTYGVRLDFAELQPTGAGVDGIFDVAINGKTVLTNFYIGTSTGAGLYNAIDKLFTAVANASGDIVIAFTGTGAGAADYAEVNGIQISTAAVNVNYPPTTIALTKTQTSPTAGTTVEAGGTTDVTYTLTVKNTGATNPAYNVVVTDPLPAGETFVSDTVPAGGAWTAADNGGKVTFTLTPGTPLAVAATATFTITVAIPASTPAGKLTNKASATAGNLQTTGGVTATATTTVGNLSVLTVSKSATTATPGQVYAGNQVTYNLGLTTGSGATSPSDAFNVVLTDPLPKGVTVASITAPAGWGDTTSSAGGVITVKFTPTGNAPLAPGSDITGFQIVGNVPASYYQKTAGNLSNTAYATTNGAVKAFSNNNTPVTTTVIDDAKLTATKTASPGSIYAGQQIKYTLGLTNAGPSDAFGTSATTGPTLTDFLTSGQTFASLNGNAATSGTTAGGIWTWNYVAGTSTLTLTDTAPMAVGSASFTLLVNTPPSFTGASLKNSVTAASNDADPASVLTAQATTNTSENATLTLGKTGPALTPPGSAMQYQLTLANTGPSNAYNVSVTDPLPFGTTAGNMKVYTTFDKMVSALPANWTESTNTTVGGLTTVTFTLAAADSLAPTGASPVVFTFLVNVPNNPALNNVTLSNTAQVNWSDPAASKANSPTVVTTVNTVPILNVTKTAASPISATGGSVYAGQDMSYTLGITNTGSKAATGVILSDPLPSQETFLSVVGGSSGNVKTSGGVTWAYTYNPFNNTVQFSTGSVAVGATPSFTIDVAVPSGTASATVLKNQATATWTNAGTASSPYVSTTVDTQDNLVVTKGVSLTAAGPYTSSLTMNNPGADVYYSITVQNTGPSDGQGIVLTDPLPAGTTFVSVNGQTAASGTFASNGWTYTAPSVGTSGTVTLTDPNSLVANNPAVTFDIVAFVPQTTANGTTLTNTATATSTVTPLNPADKSNAATATVTVDNQAKLTLTKTASLTSGGAATTTVGAGSDLFYTFTVANSGPTDAVGLTLTDPLPSGAWGTLTFVNLDGSTTTPSGTDQGWNYTFTGGNLTLSDPNPLVSGSGPVSFVLEVLVPATTPNNTQLNNTVKATATTPLAGTTSASTGNVTVINEADLTVTKTTPFNPSNFVNPGANLSYTITVANAAGFSNAQGVVLTDKLPSPETFVSLNGQTGSRGNLSTGGITWDWAYTLATNTVTLTAEGAVVSGGSTGTFTLIANVPNTTADNTVLTNTVTALSTSAESPKAVLFATVNTTVAFVSLLTLTKTGPASAAPDSTFVYTLTLYNAGPNPATNVSMSDPLPTGVVLVSTTMPAGWTESGATAGNGGIVIFTEASFGNALTGVGTATFTIKVEDTTGPFVSTTLSNLAAASATDAQAPGIIYSNATVAKPNGVPVVTTVTATPNAQFVYNVYEKLLGRAPDLAGGTYWLNELNSGAVTPTQFVLDVESSTEYLDDVVNGIYQHYLNRPADSAGLSAWVSALQSGQSIEEVTANILSSAEFFADSGGTNAGFITALYEDVLGRNPSTAELDNWLAYISSVMVRNGGGTINATTRYQIALTFLTSNEYYTDLVAGGAWSPYGPDWEGYYPELLKRSADPGGLAYWVAELESGSMTDQEVLAALFGSSEGYTKNS